MQPSNISGSNILRVRLSKESLRVFKIDAVSDAICRGHRSKQIEKIIDGIKAKSKSKQLEISKTDSFGRTSLHYAAIKGRTSVVELLLSCGFDANQMDMHKLCPLHLAIESNHYEAAIKLSQYTQPNLTNYRRETALILLCKNSTNPKMMQLFWQLMKNGNEVNMTDNRVCTALFYAVDKPILCAELLKNGIEVNHKDNFNRNALFNAVYAANIEVTNLLICSGSEVEIFDDFEHTPLMLAACFGTAQIVQILIDCGSNVNAAIQSNLWLMTPLTLAIRHDNYQIAKTLVDCGAQIDLNVSEKESIWDLIVNEKIDKEHMMNPWRRMCSKYKNKKRLSLMKYMEKEQTNRTLQSLMNAELVKKLNVPHDILHLIASPLTWY